MTFQTKLHLIYHRKLKVGNRLTKILLVNVFGERVSKENLLSYQFGIALYFHHYLLPLS